MTKAKSKLDKWLDTFERVKSPYYYPSDNIKILTYMIERLMVEMRKIANGKHEKGYSPVSSKTPEQAARDVLEEIEGMIK